MYIVRRSQGKETAIAWANSPLLEPPNALMQVSSRLIFWVCNRQHRDLGQRMLQYGLEVRGEVGKRVIAALQYKVSAIVRVITLQHAANEYMSASGMAKGRGRGRARTLNPWMKHSSSVFFMLGPDHLDYVPAWRG